MADTGDAISVEIDDHRWYATIRIARVDGTTMEVYACAAPDHDGLWIGDPVEHEEH